ncbi:DNA adenine methylase [Agrobacterium rhizogenes]|nr:DNA adenine methylase [Rhizobium rhizogenes]
MPPHEMYIETHLGGGAVLRSKEPASSSIGIDIDPRVISAAKNWEIPSLSLHLMDATTFLNDFEFSGRELIYADPPYVLSTRGNRKYYKYEYTDEDHLRLLTALKRVKCPVMISGYRCDLYDSMLQGWDTTTMTNVTQSGVRQELLWANFPFSTILHDYSVVGGGFRERERIRRKATRWCSRLQTMPIVEQHAIILELLSSPAFGGEFAERVLQKKIMEL